VLLFLPAPEAFAAYIPSFISLPGEQALPAPAASGIAFQHDPGSTGLQDLWFSRWSGLPYALAGGDGSQVSPATSERLVAYIDRADFSGDPALATGSLIVVDQASGRRLTVSDTATFKASPSLFRDTAVWADGLANRDILAYDLDADADGETDFLEASPPPPPSPITLVGGDEDQSQPSLGERGLAWVSTAGSQTSVLYRPDPAVAIETTLCVSAGTSKPAPCISGDLVVWTEVANGQSVIRVHDIVDGTFSARGDGSAWNRDPTTDGSRVAWTASYGAGPSQVYLSSSEGTVVVAPASYSQGSAKFGFGALAWEDTRLTAGGEADVAFVPLDWAQPSRLPPLTASASLVSYAYPATLRGILTDHEGESLAGRRVELYASPDAQAWKLSGAALTSSSSTSPGSYSFTVRPTARTHYEIRTSAASGHEETRSPSKVISVRAYLSRPWTYPSTVRRGSRFYVFGYLKPRHSGYTRLYFYRLVTYRRAGRTYRTWRYYTYRYARNYNYSSYTRYKLAFALRYPGYYYVRAYHYDGSHAATWGPTRVFYAR